MLKFEVERYREWKVKTFRLPIEILDKLDEIAQATNSSVNKVVLQCLEYALQEAENPTAESEEES